MASTKFQPGGGCAKNLRWEDSTSWSTGTLSGASLLSRWKKRHRLFIFCEYLFALSSYKNRPKKRDLTNIAFQAFHGLQGCRRAAMPSKTTITRKFYVCRRLFAFFKKITSFSFNFLTWSMLIRTWTSLFPDPRTPSKKEAMRLSRSVEV